MGQKQMRFTVSDQAACGSVDMGQDEAVLILLQHCQDMKRQETRLRLVSLLLLLSCVALFVFSQFHKNSGASGQTNHATPSPNFSKQDRECRADEPQTTTPKLRIDLNLRHSSTPQWTALFGENFNNNTQAIVIPEDGFYFFYLRVTFRCDDTEADFDELNVQLRKKSAGLKDPKVLAKAVDSVQCELGMFRTVSVVQLCDLIKGDQVSVSFVRGSELITESSFGGFIL